MRRALSYGVCQGGQDVILLRCTNGPAWMKDGQQHIGFPKYLAFYRFKCGFCVMHWCLVVDLPGGGALVCLKRLSFGSRQLPVLLPPGPLQFICLLPISIMDQLSAAFGHGFRHDLSVAAVALKSTN